LDPEKLEQAVKMTREANVAVVPTMVLWETIIGAADLEEMTQFPELKYMPPQEVERWKANFQRRTQAPQFNRDRARQIAENRKVLLKALHEGGVKIIFGTDAPQEFSVPGFSIHREAEAMLEAGLSPYVILETATRKMGEYLKDKDDFGTIAPGRRADLILLEANPLEDIGNLQKRAGVMARGEWLPESEIQERLEEIANSYQQRGPADR
jgi:imidazolonepropionase-like amidohydrolase